MERHMSDRSILGVADVSDAELAAMIGADAISASTAGVLDHDLEAMTTGGLFWVEGTARRGDALEPFRVVVKIAQSVVRSSVMALVPEAFRAMAVANLPWQVEPDVYRSQLATVMPDGLRLPRCLLVRDLDEESAAIWLEAVSPLSEGVAPESLALRLGRLAATPGVQAIADRIGHCSAPHQARVYLQGRLTGQHIAAYREGSVFDHPVVATHFGSLQDRLMALVDAAPRIVEEIESLPLLAAHGDACPNNLLPTSVDTVVIDWSFFGRGRVGFDLSQLLMSEIELGRATADGLSRRQDLMLSAYREGLAEQGFVIDAAALRRAHELQLAIAIGIAAVPLEQLDVEGPEGLERLDRLAYDRARALDHILTPLAL